MEDGPGKANLVPTKIGHRRALDCLVPGDSDHQTQGEGTVEDALPEFRLGAAILLIDVQQGRIVSHRREHHIVGLCDRAGDRMLEDLADFKFLDPFTRSEEYTSELQYLMRILYDVFGLYKQNRIVYH